MFGTAFYQQQAVLLAASVILGLSAVSPAQSEAVVLKQIRLAFRPKVETVDSLVSKRAALKAIGKSDSPKLAKVLIQVYGVLDREAGPLETRRQELLLKGGGSARLAPLRAEVQPIHNLQGEIIGILNGFRSPASVGVLVEAFIKPKRQHPFALRIALANRAGDLAKKDLGLVTKVKRKAVAEDRILFCKAFASLGTRAAGSVPWVIDQMQHDSIDVRIAAVKALGSLCAPVSLKPLVAQLSVERGRIRDEVIKTLQRLTGANPGPSSHSWELWLADAGQAFVQGKNRLGGKEVRGSQKSLPEVKGTGSYFGIPQDGNSILYVFDNSKSMQQKMPGQTTETRMDRCRQELHKGLDGLTPNKTFNLACFANKLRRFDDRMLSATPQNIARAHAWVDAVPLELQTNTYDALEKAFKLAGRGTSDRQYPVVADTIFFLSDGAPTLKKPGMKGLGPDKIPQILAAVQRWNPLGRVVVHAIGLGLKPRTPRQKKNRPVPGGPRGFLIKLAEQNGGRFVMPK
jgi:hypothetical protein